MGLLRYGHFVVSALPEGRITKQRSHSYTHLRNPGRSMEGKVALVIRLSMALLMLGIVGGHALDIDGARHQGGGQGDEVQLLRQAGNDVVDLIVTYRSSGLQERMRLRPGLERGLQEYVKLQIRLLTDSAGGRKANDDVVSVAQGTAQATCRLPVGTFVRGSLVTVDAETPEGQNISAGHFSSMPRP